MAHREGGSRHASVQVPPRDDHAPAARCRVDLGESAREIAATYARYCNLVRALTTDPGLRRVHGVKSPGIRKGPMFRRGAQASEG
jgi:hypothetical protein